MSGLPEGWSLTTIRDVTSADINKSGPTGTTFRYVDISSIDAAKRTTPKVLQTSEAPSRAKQVLVDNDVVVSMTRPNLNAVAFIKGLGDNVIGSTGFQVLRSDGVNARLLFYRVQSAEFIEDMSSKVQGALYPAVRPNDVLSHEFPLPPQQEQVQLVEELDKQFSRLDATSLSLDMVEAELPRLLQSWLECAFTGNLIQADFTEGLSATDFLRNLPPGQQYSIKSTFPALDFHALPILPDQWAWATTPELCQHIENGSTPPASAMTSAAGEIPFLKVYNLQFDGSIDFTKNPTFIPREVHENQLRRSRLRPGDLLINIVGPPLGKVSLVPDSYPEWNTNQAVVAFRLKQGINPRYLMYALMCHSIIGRITSLAKATAGQYNISLSMCRSLPIPVAPAHIQEQLVDELDRLFEAAKQVREFVKAARKRSSNLRQALLSSAFTGRLTGRSHEVGGSATIDIDAELKLPPRILQTPIDFPPELLYPGSIDVFRPARGLQPMNKPSKPIVSAETLAAAIREQGRPVQPSEVFRHIERARDAIDNFYVWLRDAEAEGLIEVPVAGEEEVWISAK